MNKYDITRLEQTLRRVISEMGVSRKVFSVRPYSVPESMDDFVVARVGSDVTDTGCYGYCRVYISLFAKNVDGLKNGAKLSSMYQKFMSRFPQSIDGYEFGNTPTIVGDKGDDFNFHSRVIKIETIIKVNQNGNTYRSNA